MTSQSSRPAAETGIFNSAAAPSDTVGTSKPRLLDTLGPGLITGASDDDPSGIGTYSVAGASTRYGLLWMAVFTMPLLVAVQSMAARIGACKEEGLGRARSIPRWRSEWPGRHCCAGF